jgi:hypothetical protein
MSLFDYKSFILNEGKIEDEKFNPEDIVKAVEKFAEKIKIDQKRNILEIWAYLKDRDSETEKIDKFLKDNGHEIQKVMRASSGSTPATEFTLDGILIRLVFKPFGGQQMTTLNSTITELVPILLWHAGYNGSPDPIAMITACRSVNLSKVSWASPNDAATAEKYIDMFQDSSLFNEKMENAYGIYQWLLGQNPIDLIWAYRAKPAGWGIEAKSRADIVVVTDKSAFGVSVKAKSSASSKVRKMSSTFFEALRYFGGSYIDDARIFAWNNVFSGMIQEYISDKPEDEDEMKKITVDNCWGLSDRTQDINKSLLKVIEYLYKKDAKKTDENGYYKLQAGARDILAKMIEAKPDTWVSFIKEKAGIGLVFPVTVVIAIKTTAKEIVEETEDNVSATLNKRPIVVKSITTNNKSILVSYKDDKKTYEIRNNSGGNKTAVAYRMAIDEVG